jgi:hypothetical protein
MFKEGELLNVSELCACPTIDYFSYLQIIPHHPLWQSRKEIAITFFRISPEAKEVFNGCPSAKEWSSGRNRIEVWNRPQ